MKISSREIQLDTVSRISHLLVSRHTVETVAAAKFRLAVKRWEDGNNSGIPEILENCNRACEGLQAHAEDLLRPYGIEVQYPGLYPSFLVTGSGYQPSIFGDWEDQLRDAMDRACKGLEIAIQELDRKAGEQS